jgi:hypothetical protein
MLGEGSFTRAELEAEQGKPLPDKEVISLLDLFVNIDLALDLAAPIDLAVAANANVAAPIDGAVTANVLSFGSAAQALSEQATQITQHIDADAVATAPQTAMIDQSNDVVDAGTGAGDTTSVVPVSGPAVTTDPAAGTTGTVADTTGMTAGTTDVADTTAGTVGTVADTTTGTVGTVGETTTDTVGTVGDTTSGLTEGLLDDGLLNVNVDLSLDADIAAPIAGAVAANANAAAPIDASVSANIASFDSTSTAIANQTAIIDQSITGSATATAEQNAEIIQ